ncbi:acyl-CoA dehydrogenase family protein [Rhodococcus sp. BP-349]|uniref:acyl-CoA dehydrogenase family protein n=1 Tax=unclassified Rhodococcus (in: high G+C Gram-positive bacteria) TaxID=192944 RepID=UPI001C9A6217|nr:MULTISPECIES: acyl-CoA dehydrogenase family protein [unclassified Rhodococcus (in: high G+C Gram-positive bacteria)]MBY6537967.1 acyl-CoA dehydrogenase family protein [Rhodococcus sp. BP-363]MBY6542304.1 acyl-CoA dehydrogenase family protein [Rhodococcus sp. BP-369]MBY6561534.1 acyl-CoA dehydrogenase family protein [Rhodococcus sp. BP-370]MBY6575826.1 acyl-CoA dehydrogenase family protein [Rhodococcus sp. BP-364]MBY6585127.1 acyl-CoA dehydrogenase family protein [Rhodococcus sp. BP-358]
MAIDLTYDPVVREWIERTRTFTREHVLPIEDKFLGDVTAAGGDDLRQELQAAAKDAAVFAPHAPREYGGGGLSMSDRAPVFEEAGYSLFGPIATNIGAPDEGNVHLLAHVASPAQKEQFLAPLARGDVRSAFAMTEPAPGAGSDPSALTTTATRTDGGWRIDGHKWFITGADGAGFFIVMARTSGTPGDRGGATMFLVPADTAGITIGRHISTLDRAMIGGHCEVTFDRVVVPEDNVLGAVDEGFTYAQVRLGPARMTHVMRWLGAARRGHDVAVAHVAHREGFGSRLGDLGMVQKMIADNEIDIAATRALLVTACHALDLGDPASNETSIAKTFAAEAIFRIVDRGVQMCGGLGVSDDLPLARLSREVRPFRVYDGPSEVHRWAIAKRAVGAARRAAKEQP